MTFFIIIKESGKSFESFFFLEFISIKCVRKNTLHKYMAWQLQYIIVFNANRNQSERLISSAE